MRITPVVSSRFRSDGGAMFGLVPKPIWSRLIEANEYNGIPQNANNLLVELDDGRTGLVDTGCGSPTLFSEKEQALHGFPDANWPMTDALDSLGIVPEQIDFVVLSHLHWDHAGGTGQQDGSGQRIPFFQHATHYIHAQEWEDATSGNPLFYKAYPESTLAPLRQLAENHRVSLVEEDEAEVMPGVRMVRTGGHTKGHCAVFFESATLSIGDPCPESLAYQKQAVYMGEMCPTQHHLRMVFQMAYDTFPLDTRAWKRTWLPRLAEEQTLVFFDHDPELFAATILPDPRREFIVNEFIAIQEVMDV